MRRIGRLCRCFSMILVFVTLFPNTTVFASVNDLTLYQRASEVSRAFGTAVAPGSAGNSGIVKGKNDSDLIIAGNAGGLLGYVEILEGDKGIVGWLMSSFTATDAVITYEMLENVFDTDVQNPYIQYAGYGQALTDMGLVQRVRKYGILSMGRYAATMIMLLLYLTANVAPFLFRVVIVLLDWLNPFKVFGAAMSGIPNDDLGVLSDLAGYISSIYQMVQNFSILILFPTLLAFTTVSVLMFRKGSAMKKFSRYGLRVFMLFAGLPLIGATYTGVIEGMDSRVSVGSDYADYLVLSSYVDFENWVKTTRLAPPDGGVIANPRLSEDNQFDDMNVVDRGLVLNINAERTGNEQARTIADRYAADSIRDSRVDLDEFDPDTYRASFNKTFDLLMRHMRSETYSGSRYDGDVMGQIQKVRDSGDDEAIIKMLSLTDNNLRAWFEQLTGANHNIVDWDNSNGLFTHGTSTNRPDFQFGEYDYHIYNAGGMVSRDGRYYMDFSVNPVNSPIGTQVAGVVGGLSPLAMYNFLNTSFSSSGLRIHASERSSDDLSVSDYASVVFAGSGIMPAVRWIENTVVMLSLSMLSISFGVTLLSAVIQNIPRVLTGVFGTALGSIGSTVRLLIAVIVMIVQVLGLMFFYFLGENIVMVLLLNFDAITGDLSLHLGSSGLLVEFTKSFLVTTIIFSVTIFIVRNMRAFRMMLTEVVANSIDRMVGFFVDSAGQK